MLVDQYDAILALHRGVRGADVHAGRIRAVLTHQRQRVAVAGPGVADLDLANPVGLLQLVGLALGAIGSPAVFLLATAHAGVAALLALVGVDQHAPAILAAGRLLRRLGDGDLVQQDAGGHGHAREDAGRATEETATGNIGVAHCCAPSTAMLRVSGLSVSAGCAMSMWWPIAFDLPASGWKPIFSGVGVSRWQSKQSMVTPA